MSDKVPEVVTENEVVPVESKQMNPMGLIEMAVSQNADIDKLEKLMVLQERWEKNEARKAYVKAMADFKKNPPEISKDSHVRYETQKGITEYSHATLANVTSTINSALSAHGLSAGWVTEQNEKEIAVICTITHILGHSESTKLSAFPDTTGSKNSIQAIGSTITYLQRYTLLTLTGLATHEDDDGKSSESVEHITPNQVADLNSMITELKADEPAFLKWLGVESIETIPANDYGKAVNGLNRKRSGN